MPRPVGSKNRLKNAPDLLKEVVALYEKQGKQLKVSFEDIANLTGEQQHAIAKEVETNPDINTPEIFALDGGENDNEYTYKCGHCGEALEGEVALCPYCGKTLRWE